MEYDDLTEQQKEVRRTVWKGLLNTICSADDIGNRPCDRGVLCDRCQYELEVPYLITLHELGEQLLDKETAILQAQAPRITGVLVTVKGELKTITIHDNNTSYQKLVGGYYELIHNIVPGTDIFMMVDEEGKLKNKSVNYTISNFCRNEIVGDVLFLKFQDNNEAVLDYVSLNDTDILTLQNKLLSCGGRIILDSN